MHICTVSCLSFLTILQQSHNCFFFKYLNWCVALTVQFLCLYHAQLRWRYLLGLRLTGLLRSHKQNSGHFYFDRELVTLRSHVRTTWSGVRFNWGSLGRLLVRVVEISWSIIVSGRKSIPYAIHLRPDLPPNSSVAGRTLFQNYRQSFYLLPTLCCSCITYCSYLWFISFPVCTNKTVIISRHHC